MNFAKKICKHHTPHTYATQLAVITEKCQNKEHILFTKLLTLLLH